ncbi:Uma2 family endonuclease [Clostridium baratii]
MLAKENTTYNYNDYLTYKENDRIEIIGGKIYNMAPAPSRIHQQLISDISYELQHYIKHNNGSCKVYVAPFDVILINDGEEANNSKNIVQPDISVICDKSKLTDKGCTGSPDMIVEVVSPYNPSNDFVRKLNLYQEYNVKEYWIINPMDRSILVYLLSDNGYNAPLHYTFSNKIKVNIFGSLEIDFSTFDL